MAKALPDHVTGNQHGISKAPKGTFWDLNPKFGVCDKTDPQHFFILKAASGQDESVANKCADIEVKEHANTVLHGHSFLANFCHMFVDQFKNHLREVNLRW